MDKYERDADKEAFWRLAFSEQQDSGLSVRAFCTREGMNGFGEKQLPAKFTTDDFQFLIVAEKYQNGFDQPLLVTVHSNWRAEAV